MNKLTRKVTHNLAIITMLSASIVTGCNEPKQTVPGYQKADWAGLNELITKVDKMEIDECIKNKSTCQALSDDAANIVKSMEDVK